MQQNPLVERINQLQARVLAGQDPPAEEMAEAIAALRASREIAVETRAKAKSAAAAKDASIDILAIFGPGEAKP